MANEAVLRIETELPINFIVADGAGIERGALLKETTPMTASAANGTNDIIAGIAAREKIASNGQTRLAVYRKGVFLMYASGNITAGDTVGSVASWPNYVISSFSTALSGNKVVGHALQDITAGNAGLIELTCGSK
jgi:hypothetical protein